MHTDLRDAQKSVDARQHRVESCLPVRERLAIAAFVTAVSLWIHVVEVIPDNRRRSFSTRNGRKP
jgi:hypothetical protein